jgi:hypothetical protein
MTPACDDCGAPAIARRANEERRFAVSFSADTRVAAARAG